MLMTALAWLKKQSGRRKRWFAEVTFTVVSVAVRLLHRYETNVAFVSEEVRVMTAATARRESRSSWVESKYELWPLVG